MNTKPLESFFAQRPFSHDGSGFTLDANGDRVLCCYADDLSLCDRRFSERLVDSDPNLICNCGRLGQRMDELPWDAK